MTVALLRVITLKKQGKSQKRPKKDDKNQPVLSKAFDSLAWEA